VLRLPVVIFSLTIHEFMHAWTAWKCGDDTALRLGRVSLNPLVHLDLIGTIMLFFGPIGWAKPVPVNPYNYRNLRLDDILVSGAGVAINFVTGCVLAILVRVLLWQDLGPVSPLGQFLWGMLGWAIMINLGLAMFNLLPFHPLDGSHIFSNLMPAWARVYFEENRNVTMVALGVLLLANWLVWPGFLYLPAIYLMVFLTGHEGAGNLLMCMWPNG
jgi:Zn-dependent protease